MELFQNFMSMNFWHARIIKHLIAFYDLIVAEIPRISIHIITNQLHIPRVSIFVNNAQIHCDVIFKFQCAHFFDRFIISYLQCIFRFNAIIHKFII